MRCLDYHVTQPLLGEEEIVCQVSHLDKLPVCAKEIATEPNIAIKSAGPNFVGMAQSFHRWTLETFPCQEKTALNRPVLYPVGFESDHSSKL